MSDIAIRVEGLGKKYRIGSAAPYHRLSEMISGLGSASVKALAAPFRNGSGNSHATKGLAAENPTEFWALRDVSFEVKEGEVVGVIGRNGAGKSTLLKILSRITEPTTGRFGVKGRVASLLEVGTGFHPELTGRENIYTSGILLGMTRAEVKKRFDEIVDFSGVEKFLDTPVKRYSSGMQVRLGFAVAAHLESEILIVDEVLAVGDAEFQKQCLGKMGDVAKSGRTVLFVSHNMGAVANLTSQCLLLEAGRASGPHGTAEAMDAYQASFRRAASPCTAELARPSWVKKDSPLRIIEASLGEHPSSTAPGDLSVDITCQLSEPCKNIDFVLSILDRQETRVVTSNYCDRLSKFLTLPTGQSRVRSRLPNLRLPPGDFRIEIAAQTPWNEVLDIVVGVLAFTVTADEKDQLCQQHRGAKRFGVRIPSEWQTV